MTHGTLDKDKYMRGDLEEMHHDHGFGQISQIDKGFDTPTYCIVSGPHISL